MSTNYRSEILTVALFRSNMHVIDRLVINQRCYNADICPQDLILHCDDIKKLLKKQLKIM